jgi:hypothetical protein
MIIIYSSANFTNRRIIVIGIASEKHNGKLFVSGNVICVALAFQLPGAPFGNEYFLSHIRNRKNKEV